MKRLIYCALVTMAAALCGRAWAINIRVDYTYDSGFFNTAQKRAPLEAAAARWSEVITTSLSAVTLSDNGVDRRIGFTHPSTGLSYEISAAHGVGSDVIGTPSASCTGCYPAHEYRGNWSIPANEWILYAGARSLGSAAVAGTGTGLNLNSQYTDGSSHLNRNFRPSGGVQRLPVWGGAISFDNDGSTNWHYDLTTPAPLNDADLYSIALHEIGHALGLSTGWLDWTGLTADGKFYGSHAVSTYNQDNGTAVPSLDLATTQPDFGARQHWEDGTYDSFIFHNASPNYVGTVGPGNLQDLIMEPTANFTGSIRRFELTNVDVAALRDVGWATVPQIAPSQPGDYNGDGVVNAADYVVWRKGEASGTYAVWRENFGEVAGAGGSLAFARQSDAAGGGVPEPSAMACILSGLYFIGRLRSLGRRQRVLAAN